MGRSDSHSIYRQRTERAEAIRRNHPMHFINHVDIAPTTLGLCGIPVPEDMEGYDYSPLIVDTPPYHKVKTLPDMPDSAYISLPVPQAMQPGPFEEGIDGPFRGVVTRDGWEYVAMSISRGYYIT